MSSNSSATETGIGLLFAYGTLGPRDSDDREAGGWVRDAVRGRLFDLGPYPALVDCDNPTADWVEGHVRSVEARELIEQLDFYEGVDEGLYRRIAAHTRGGLTVWVYEYARKPPTSAIGPLTVWRSFVSKNDEDCRPDAVES